MPARVRRYNPQLATLTDVAPSGPEWIHELKYDGYRIGAIVAGSRVRLESRREIDWTARFPEVVEAVRQLACRSAVIDGEVAITEPSGRTSFQKLQNIFEKAGGRAGLTYYVFDLLELDAADLTKLPLEQRKALLEKLVDDGDSLSNIRVTSKATARTSSSTLAGWAARGSYRSAEVTGTARDAVTAGSRRSACNAASS